MMMIRVVVCAPWAPCRVATSHSESDAGPSHTPGLGASDIPHTYYSTRRGASRCGASWSSLRRGIETDMYVFSVVTFVAGLP